MRRLVRGGMKPGQGLLVAVSGVGVGPPNMPSHWITRAVCLVIARGFAAAALLPLQALPGAPLERLYWAPLLLGLLHATSALAALACPALIQLVSPTRVLSIAYILLTAFFATFLYPKVISFT